MIAILTRLYSRCAWVTRNQIKFIDFLGRLTTHQSSKTRWLGTQTHIRHSIAFDMFLHCSETSDVNKNLTLKAKDKDKDQTYKDKDQNKD